MKKFLSLCAAFLLLCCCAIPAFAEVPTQNGTYEVPIELWHATKDQVSMGNQYIVGKALVEMENGQKYMTLVSDKDVDGLQFWYYTDGGVTGATASAEKVSNVKLGGKTYSVGYRFPLVTDSEYAGVKFQAPIMPVSPSARVKIDYSSLQVIELATEATKPAATTSTATMKQTTDASESTSESTTETSVETLLPETTTAVTEASKGESSTATWKIIVPVVVVLIVAGVVTVVVIRKRNG